MPTKTIQESVEVPGKEWPQTECEAQAKRLRFLYGFLVRQKYVPSPKTRKPIAFFRPKNF
jgi:hypothetical protein